MPTSSCRNVLIYLDRDLQEQVCSTFHYALNPGGFCSSAPPRRPITRRDCSASDRQARIYQSTRTSGAKRELLPRLLGPVRMREEMMPLPQSVTPTTALSEAAAHRRAIEQIAPPSILVDEAHRVLHLSEMPAAICCRREAP